MDNKSAKNPVPGSVTFRPEGPDDEAFLLAVYATTRQDELALTNWDATMKTAFVNSQFKAMRVGYAGMFPDAQFSIILLEDRPVGRIVIHRSAREIRVVDMVLLPEYCGRGIGAGLMNNIIAEARAAQKPVALHVLKMNRAFRFYERMGFFKTGDEGCYDAMEWRPAC